MRQYSHGLGLSRSNTRRNMMALARATIKPSISGTYSAGNLLTAAPGDWPPSGATVTYQWTLDMVAIPGETAATHTVLAAEEGRSLGVLITSTDPVYGQLQVGILAVRP